jgi:hypothetical protein
MATYPCLVKGCKEEFPDENKRVLHRRCCHQTETSITLQNVNLSFWSTLTTGL